MSRTGAVVYLPSSAHVDAVRALLDREIDLNPNLNGAEIRIAIDANNGPWVEGLDELVGAILLSQIRDLLRDGVKS